MQKQRCHECKERFEIDLKEYDDGDTIDCPDCGAEMLVECDKDGRPKLITPKEKFLEEDDEFVGDEEETE